MLLAIERQYLSAIDVLPYVKDSGRQGYKDFLSKGAPRAFAISSSGAWGYCAADNGEDPAGLVVARCQEHSKRPCALYAVDDEVV